MKELHEYVHENDLDRDRRALTSQRRVIIVTPALTAEQERLKKNEEERKKAEEEKTRKLLKAKGGSMKPTRPLSRERKAALSAENAEIKSARKENKELLKKIVSLEATIRSSIERTPRTVHENESQVPQVPLLRQI